MPAVDLYVLPDYWLSGYAEGELGINPYASGAEWALGPRRKRPEDEPEAKIEAVRQQLAVPAAPSRVLDTLAQRIAQRIAQRADAAEAQDRALRAALRAEGIRYRKAYSAALAAYTAVWRAFQRQQQEIDEDMVTALLLLH